MKKRYNVISLISFLIFLLMYILLRIDCINNFDDYVYSFFVINDFNTAYMTIITFFGEPKTIFYITILLLLFLNNRRIKTLIVLNTLLGLNIFHFLKVMIKRPRPIGINLINASGYSFPSGHTFMSLVFYGFLLYLINRNTDRYTYKSLINIILILLIVLVPISRIYLGVHYASDTVAGFTLALTYLFTYIFIIKRKKLL